MNASLDVATAVMARIPRAMKNEPLATFEPRPPGVTRRNRSPGLTARHVRIGFVDYGAGSRRPADFIWLLDVYRLDGDARAHVPEDAINDAHNGIVLAPGADAASHWLTITRPGTYMAVVFDPCAPESEAAQIERQEQRIAGSPIVVFDGHALRAIMLALGRVLRDRARDVDGYVEALGVLFIHELNKLFDQQTQSAPLEGALSARQTQTVLEYIASNLQARITVAELAGLVALSRFHFIRAFKKSTGASPHQFIIRRRIERAKEMLADRRLSITDVARGTGFNGLTQLTRVFRQVVGMTPTTFRRDIE